MTVRVQDWKENEIKVGTKCIYGAPPKADEFDEDTGMTLEDYIVEITEISEPDVYYNPVTDTDDGGYGVKITFKFKDGQTDTVDVMINTSASRDEYETTGEVLEVFEEGGDLEVITEGHTHTHTIRDGKPVCVYCGEEMEL
jgi:hypothetical protein